MIRECELPRAERSRSLPRARDSAHLRGGGASPCRRTRAAGRVLRAVQSPDEPQPAAQVVQVVSDISTALREQSAASADISRHVDQIAHMAEENNASVASNAATASELEQLATRLQSEIARFKVA